MALKHYIERRFGVPTRNVEDRERSTIGTTAALVLRQDPNRISALIVNLSTNVLFLARTGAVSTTRGVRLSPSGGAVLLDPDIDGETVGYEWYIVADAGAGNALYTNESLGIGRPEE